MKNTTKYLAVICTGILAIAGCQKPEMDVNEIISGDEFVITATLSEEGADTRTQMVPGNDANSYKVEWQAGDAIQTNGKTSTEINISASNASSATFTFDGGVFDAPYYAVYPASAASGFENNKYTVTLPEEQTCAGSDKFAPQSALMLGYSATSGNVAFKHAMAYIRLTLTSGENPIKSVKLESNNQEALSGSFTAACTDGIWTMSEGSAASVTLNCGAEGAAIGEKMLIAIPADTYEGGLTVTVTDTKNHYMARKATNSFTAEMGGIYDMAFEFVAQGTVVEGNIDINTVDDWTAFAKAVTGGDTYEGKTITLQSNLTVDTYFEYANGTFEGTFDGNGKTMTANGNKWPLFATVGTKGVVKNITMDGKYIGFANAGEAGNATIAKFNKGLIQDVINNSDATGISVTTGVVFASICGHNGGTLERCKNYGDISITYASTGNNALYGGGLCALGHTVSGDPAPTALNVDETCTPGQFIDCENHGNITVTTTNGKPVRQGFGGICGLVYFNGVKFENCTNTGNISRVSNGEASNNFSASVGGILGRSAGWYTTGTGDSGALDTSINGFDTEFTKCSNSGTINCVCRHSGGITKNGTFARTDGVGGIVGTTIGTSTNIAKLTSCSNTGKITGGWNANVNTTALGGLIGIANYTELYSCSSICSIESVSNSYYIGAAGGLVACAMTDVKVKDNCVAVPKMNIYAYSGKPFLYGLVLGNISASASVSASVGGNIIAGGNDLGITSANYTNYLVASDSNVALLNPVTSWYAGSAN
jgi:hypothetical protein